MPKGLFVVFTNTTDPKRADEFNEWYNSVHVRDALAVKGIKAGTRYRLADVQFAPPGAPKPKHEYLCIYEIEADDFTDIQNAMIEVAPTWVVSDTIDVMDIAAGTFEQITERLVE